MPFTLIIVIGWLYVTLLVAAHEPSLTAGVFSFLFYGALPCGLVIYFAGARVRRERQRFKAHRAPPSTVDSPEPKDEA